MFYFFGLESTQSFFSNVHADLSNNDFTSRIASNKGVLKACNRVFNTWPKNVHHGLRCSLLHTLAHIIEMVHSQSRPAKLVFAFLVSVTFAHGLI